ncbi:helix-turn-helix transcriptional regulator [Haloarcula salina]|uniref:helix-turn-helix transcriptional regulator n=1 Tax=Haloarcula salina TaxID=1429914 RepID=UPI003C702D95
MGRTFGAVAVGIVVVALLVPTATGAGFGALDQQSVDPDVVVMTADVAADGNADWAVAYRVRLADDNETAAFEDLQADIRANSSAYTDRFAGRMERTARAAENATGREMAIENVTVSTRTETLGQTYGVVTYRFTWTNFAAASGGRLEIGDSLSGLFLDGETSLTVRWPSAYQAERVTPSPDERTNTSVTWRGQQEFGADEPRVVVTSGSAASDDGGSSTLLVGGALALLALVAAAYAVRRYGLSRDDEPADRSEPTKSTDTTADAASPPPDDADGGADAEAPPPDLLSNEEQVVQLLEANGGRLKQQQVASELDWTDAKTSQVISGLRDDEAVETFRIGRENVVTLPDTDLTGGNGDAADSDDEEST